MLKKPVSEHPSTVNMLNEKLYGSIFITMAEIELEIVRFSDIWNLRSVC